MKDSNAERTLRKFKGFTNSVKQMLNQEYKFLAGDKIQDMFIKDLLEEIDRHLKDGWKLDAGRVVWWAAHKDEYPGRNKTIENTRMVPVILSIASQDDLLLRLEVTLLKRYASARRPGYFGKHISREAFSIRYM